MPAQLRAPDCDVPGIPWPAFGQLPEIGHDVSRRFISRRFCEDVLEVIVTLETGCYFSLLPWGTMVGRRQQQLLQQAPAAPAQIRGQ